MSQHAAALGTALDRLETGDWEAAHALAQDDPSALGAWVHALLHRIEGDPGNAGYWYARAGRAPFEGSTDEEIRAIRAALGA